MSLFSSPPAVAAQTKNTINNVELASSLSSVHSGVAALQLNIIGRFTLMKYSCVNCAP
jgi:hypothetical protein